MTPLRTLAAAVAVIAAMTAPADAQTVAETDDQADDAVCGGPDAPCEIEGGLYHFSPAGAPDAPAVIFLHGWGGTGRGVIRNRGLANRLRDRGYALIAPQGMPRWEGDEGGGWSSVPGRERRDDVAFLAAVAGDAAARHGVDRRRIVLAGFSGGGMMTWRTACEAPDSFAAYAPVAGLLWRPLPESCAGPFRMLHTHGWSDVVVPIEGRSVAGGQITQGDLFRGLDLLRAALGCVKDDPDAYAERDAYLIRRWTDCAEGGELEMALHPGGHGVPRGWDALALDWYEGAAEGD